MLFWVSVECSWFSWEAIVKQCQFLAVNSEEEVLAHEQPHPETNMLALAEQYRP